MKIIFDIKGEMTVIDCRSFLLLETPQNTFVSMPHSWTFNLREISTENFMLAHDEHVERAKLFETADCLLWIKKLQKYFIGFAFEERG